MTLYNGYFLQKKINIAILKMPCIVPLNIFLCAVALKCLTPGSNLIPALTKPRLCVSVAHCSVLGAKDRCGAPFSAIHLEEV